jgi:signal peptidase I
MEILLIVLFLITGGVWLVDRFVLSKKRSKDITEPKWVEYSKGLFPVVVVVFCFRSFLFQPFNIPSESMMPTLIVGDYILTNKFTYGIRLPVINKKIISINNPKRGDVLVFHYPPNPSLDYIKRVIGVPGDFIEYNNKKLKINGIKQSQTPNGELDYTEYSYGDAQHDLIDLEAKAVHLDKNQELLDGVKHDVFINAKKPTFISTKVSDFVGRENCIYKDDLIACKVPKDSYFVMGDNRDNSIDSRYWGFVKDEQIVGKAFMIISNFSDFKRSGIKF